MSESFIEEIKSEELYHLYKTNSTQIDKELLQKFKEFPIITDFFKHFTNIDIKLLHQNINIFFLPISSIADLNSLNTFESSIEQYISDFSQLYLVLNAICKIKDTIEKIVTKINSSLPMLYQKHNLDKDYQNKINEITRYMLNTNNRGNISSNSTFDNSENSFNYQTKSNKSLNIEKIELIKDLLGKEYNNHKALTEVIDTPRFNNDLNNKEIIPLQKEECASYEEKQLRKNSLESKFTFRENNQTQEKENLKDNLNKRENLKNNEDNILGNDVNDYITSVPKSLFTKKNKSMKKRNIYHSFKDLTSKKFRDNEVKAFELNIEEKIPFHESSGKLIANEDSKMYADLLEIIFELYKKGKISYEQKVELKKLIIKKCPKILNVYKTFQNIDNEKLVNELKGLI